MKHEVKFIRGHDCILFECIFNSSKCVPKEGGSHGRSGLDIVFLVHGNKGAVQFKLSTGWMPLYSKVSRIGVRSLNNELSDLYPMPIDLGYHSYEPMYEGHTSVGKCEILKGKKCYYDGSSLNSHDAYYTLINAGENALWEFLEQFYRNVFEDGEYPDVKGYPKELR